MGEGVRWKIPLGNTGRRSSWEREACVRTCVCASEMAASRGSMRTQGVTCARGTAGAPRPRRVAGPVTGRRGRDRLNVRRQWGVGVRGGGGCSHERVRSFFFEHFIGGTTPAAYTRLQ